MTKQYSGTGDVAAHLGTTPSNISNWLKNASTDFPKPDVEIISGGRVTHRGWCAERLVELRAWMLEHRGIDPQDAEEYWRSVDEKNQDHARSRRDHVSPGQEKLF